MSIGTSALARQYPLVIVPQGEKGPKTKQWQIKWPTCEEVELALAAHKNLGLILGPRSGVIDIEVDGPEGEASRHKLFNGEPPRTPRWPSLRGRHDLYKYDPRFEGLGANFTHPEYPGLEFRIGADKGAQSIIPPSEVDGFRREWEIDLADSDPAELPESVIQRILSLKSPSQTGYGDDEFGLGLQEGKRRSLEVWHTKVGLPYRIEEDEGVIRFHYPFCPIKGPNHVKGNSVLFINSDGSHVFHCHHGQCAERTFTELEIKYGPFDRPIIKTGPDIHRVTDEAIHSLRGAENVYQRGVLVEVTNDAPMPRLCLNDNGAPRLRQIPRPTLDVLLSRHARWIRRDGNRYVACPPPQRIVAAVDSASNLRGIPVVTGIVSVPVLRADGEILVKQGYDRDTGLFLDIDGTYPPLSTLDDAIGLLNDVLFDFPFASEAHRSAGIAALVTMLARPAFSGPAPLFLIDANASRVGKGLLTDLFTMIFEHRKAARYSAPKTEDEMRKLITSVALSGAPYLLFDNIKGRFGGPTIENAMTAGRWSDRILGGNKQVDIPLSVVWLATANNVTLTQDMVGRTCHCRLNTPLERPDTRVDFRHSDLLGHVKEHRAALAIAALSIPAAYIKAGRPNMHLQGWGGFEGWSDLVRSSIVWAGLPDPDTRTALAEQADDETATLRQLMDSWEELGFPATVAKVFEVLDNADISQYPNLRETVRELAGDKRHSLGNLLKTFRHRVVGGRYFDRTDGKTPKWHLYQTAENTVAA